MVRIQRLSAPLLLAFCAACATASSDAVTPDEGPAPVVVQPGAPGQASRVVEARNISELGLPPWTQGDVDFMAGMIHHHAQALQMTALIEDRSRSAGVRQMGLRMEISQRDEIRLMQNWLSERDQEVPEVVLEKGPDQGTMSGEGMDHGAMGHSAMGDMAGSGGDMPGGLMEMPGMLSAEQMRTLRDSEGDAFDALFLEYMIQHHTGAIAMVHELFATPGAGQDSKVFQFADDVEADQLAEIDRMQMLLQRYR